jgi:hypothetical protein
VLGSLEERVMPTVDFDPVFEKEYLASSAPFTVLNSPTVYLIFWGRGWGQNQLPGPSAVTTLANDARAVLSSTYFSGLREYGSDGNAVYGGSWTDATTDPPANYNVGGGSPIDIADRQGEIGKAITSNPFCTPSGPSITQSPIYLAIPVGGSSGWNSQRTYGSDTINMCSVGGASNSSGTTYEDWFTQALSHELAERISDPGSGGVTIFFPSDSSFPGYINETTTPPSVNNDPYLTGDQAYLANGSQIGDGEQEPGGQAHYGYRLNGVKVQSLWSAQTPASSGVLGAFTDDSGYPPSTSTPSTTPASCCSSSASSCSTWSPTSPCTSSRDGESLILSPLRRLSVQAGQ